LIAVFTSYKITYFPFLTELGQLRNCMDSIEKVGFSAFLVSFWQLLPEKITIITKNNNISGISIQN
jgi:hypothetical protein